MIEERRTTTSPTPTTSRASHLFAVERGDGVVAADCDSARAAVMGASLQRPESDGIGFGQEEAKTNEKQVSFFSN